MGGSYPSNGDVPPPGYQPGFDGRSLQNGTWTEWAIGSTQEVHWSIAANHGGGYAIRLCPLNQEQTEECFQNHHLSFEGDSTWIQFGNDVSNRTKITANRTTLGTTPSGSQWTKVPIPSCGGAAGGGLGCILVVKSRSLNPQSLVCGEMVQGMVVLDVIQYARTTGLAICKHAEKSWISKLWTR